MYICTNVAGDDIMLALFRSRIEQWHVCNMYLFCLLVCSGYILCYMHKTQTVFVELEISL